MASLELTLFTLVATESRTGTLNPHCFRRRTHVPMPGTASESGWPGDTAASRFLLVRPSFDDTARLLAVLRLGGLKGGSSTSGAAGTRKRPWRSGSVCRIGADADPIDGPDLIS